MVELKGYKVAIVVQGQDLPEHIDQELNSKNPDNVIDVHIQAQSGELFSIKFQATQRSFLDPKAVGAMAQATVDGTINKGYKALLLSWPYEFAFAGHSYSGEGMRYEQAYKFGDLAIGKYSSFQLSC